MNETNRIARTCWSCVWKIFDIFRHKRIDYNKRTHALNIPIKTRRHYDLHNLQIFHTLRAIRPCAADIIGYINFSQNFGKESAKVLIKFWKLETVIKLCFSLAVLHESEVTSFATFCWIRVLQKYKRRKDKKIVRKPPSDAKENWTKHEVLFERESVVEMKLGRGFCLDFKLYFCFKEYAASKVIDCAKVKSDKFFWFVIPQIALHFLGFS